MSDTGPKTFSTLKPRAALLLIAINALPLLHVLSIAAGAYFFIHRGAAGLGVLSGVALLYLPPPLLCRLARWIDPLTEQRIVLGSRAFFVWWFTMNLQILFARLPALEEAIRLVPGLYSLWLRLWGSRIGRLTYWAPGMRLLDRAFLSIGDNVTFGAGVRLNAHVLAPDEHGNVILLLAPIAIGDRAFIGGYALLTAGARIDAGETTRAKLVVPPFGRFSAGRRRKPFEDSPDPRSAS